MHARALGKHPRYLRGSLAGQRQTATTAIGRRDDRRFDRSLETLPCSQAPPGQGGFSVEISYEEHGGRLVAAGEFDGAALARFEAAITELIDDGRPIVLDLSGLTFIDSSGLWAVTLTQRICRQRHIGLLIEPGPESVQSVFEVTGLADLLPFASVPMRQAASVHGLSGGSH